MAAVKVGNGVYRVFVDGRWETVYVAGPAGDRWAFWNGRVFRADFTRTRARASSARAGDLHALTAPMPATVRRVQVKAGDAVRKGDVVALLEAMKMELPLRAPGDGTVSAVRCQEGDLVPADAVLVEFA